MPVKKTISNPFSISLNEFIEKIESYPISKISNFDSLLSDLANEAYDAYEFVIEVKEGDKNIPDKSDKDDAERFLKEVKKLLDIFEEMDYDSKYMDRCKDFLGTIEEELPGIIKKMK